MPNPDMRMVVLGDSVTWGQGLLMPQKFYSMVKLALSGTDCTTNCAVLAHSGATIGVGVNTIEPAVDGEVPTSYPTILQQCNGIDDAPERVDLVLVSGGINDIDVRFILDPFTDASDLKDAVDLYCYRDMKILLKSVIDKFTKPACRFVVTSYFPILSAQSDVPQVEPFLSIHGITLPEWLERLLVVDKIVQNATLFWQRSQEMLAEAVDDMNRGLGGAPRLFLAAPPFSAENAALAPAAWLFGLNPDLTSQDPVAKQRREACDLYENDLIQREKCYRASAGHPNQIGAQRFAMAILSCLT
jgi:lysophospholipase L1-like esterase